MTLAVIGSGVLGILALSLLVTEVIPRSEQSSRGIALYAACMSTQGSRDRKVSRAEREGGDPQSIAEWPRIRDELRFLFRQMP
jgi:hypothetical protein